MGISRSSTVVLAYLLSPSNPDPRPKTVDEAIALLRESRPIIGPNEGFYEQLILYHQMGCPEDVMAQSAYQRWVNQKEIQQSNACGRAPDFIYFSDTDPKPEEAVIISPPTNPTSAPHKESRMVGPIRCRKCGHTLGSHPFVVTHAPEAQSQDQALSVGEKDVPSSQPCAHIFLDPLSWMKSELEKGKLDGRLECPNPKCKAQVGKYAWQGLRCSCGKWIVPGISLSRAKVDEMSIRQGIQERKPASDVSPSGKENL
jgi:dual specificity phosphatase 12